MKHQRQGEYECLPTSIAILVDIDKDVVIEWAREWAQRQGFPVSGPWPRFTHDFGPSRFWTIACAVLDHFLYPGAGAAHRLANNWARTTGRQHETTSGAAGGPRLRVRRTLRGRGLLTVSYQRTWHAVAFADDVVYDPTNAAPMPFREWRVTNPKWRIRAVQYYTTQGRG